jgi:hypothetical protein
MRHAVVVTLDTEADAEECRFYVQMALEHYANRTDLDAANAPAMTVRLADTQDSRPVIVLPNVSGRRPAPTRERLEQTRERVHRMLLTAGANTDIDPNDSRYCPLCGA